MVATFSYQELLRITGGAPARGEAAPRYTSQGVEFDSRAVKGGELFVALKGASVHGHAFLSEVFAKGAALALVEDPAATAGLSEPDRCIVVPDTLHAFSSLARFWRGACNIPTIGITGSVGKTTTKELLAAILMQHGVGNYSQKSFNNHTGVPYTILRTARHHRWLVLEMGMNHAGEISHLASIGSPDVGVITTIAPAHIENFKDIHGIADAKCELLGGLRQGAPIIVNGDDEVLLAGVERADPECAHPRLLFGRRADATVQIASVESHGLEGLTMELRIPEGTVRARVGILGSHNATNIAAAVTAARAAFPALTLQEIEQGLGAFRAPLMRLNIRKLREGKVLIDDSYNANPTSMKGMLEIAGELKREGLAVGLVLGDMLELGAASEQFHRALGKQVASLAPQFLIVVGEAARFIEGEASAGGVRSTHAATPEAAAHLVEKSKFDVVIIKGSRGVALDRAAQQLVDRLGGVLP